MPEALPSLGVDRRRRGFYSGFGFGNTLCAVYYINHRIWSQFQLKRSQYFWLEDQLQNIPKDLEKKLNLIVIMNKGWNRSDLSRTELTNAYYSSWTGLASGTLTFSAIHRFSFCMKFTMSKGDGQMKAEKVLK